MLLFDNYFIDSSRSLIAMANNYTILYIYNIYIFYLICFYHIRDRVVDRKERKEGKGNTRKGAGSVIELNE